MTTDPHGALRDALHKALTTAKKPRRRGTLAATSLDDAVAHHYTPEKKDENK
ncbi:hypothetical protein [Gordonia sp. SCSIO 19800]|uniref:hypothetical protein n=1 Tax=Gordonia sp. SCSIO 19800 TaxID=2826926 RepID=UPI001B820C48|nr:hypothetical protein [Gordonia sp. SCSIO 19800]MBR7191915.1 hypothetical protein [Gordonia sp. SCSIO 19800]